MKKTKIIATFGPSLAKSGTISSLIEAGVNLFRINCSHGNTADFTRAARLIRLESRGHQYPIGILFDISGPKLRLDRFKGELSIKTGQKLFISSGDSNLEKNIIGVNHPGIIKSVKVGQRFFVDDGNLSFEIISVSPDRLTIKSNADGVLLPAKGINLPDTDIKISTITSKDKLDIKTAVACNADYIALSFVRSGDDIIKARKIIKQLGGNQKIIAKLEKREAIESLDEIMLLSDGVMVARGDLGVELPPEHLPHLQKEIINKANRHQKPVIVATQMLESMRFSPRATRAEINDVASAVFDFVDSVMLSAETASGNFPLEAVRAMSNVITATEPKCKRPTIEIESHLIKSEIPHAIAEAVSRSETHCATKAIYAFTSSGFTAELISNLFPSQPIIALTSDKAILSRLTLFRSVYPVLVKQPRSFAAILRVVDKVSLEHKLAKKGEPVIVTGGIPLGSTVPTNFMLYHRIGEDKKKS